MGEKNPAEEVKNEFQTEVKQKRADGHLLDGKLGVVFSPHPRDMRFPLETESRVGL